MRIGVAWRYFHERSGLPRYCSELVRRLGRTEDVYLFANSVEVELPIRGVVRFPFFFHSDRVEYGPNTLLNSSIVSLGKRRLDLDIVNTQNATLLGQDVITVHGTWWRHYEIHAKSDPRMARELRKSLMPVFEKINYRGRRYRRLIAVSGLASRELQESYGVPEDDIAVVYEGADTERFREDPGRRGAWRRANGLEDMTVLLHVSTDFLRKGLWTIVRGLPYLPKTVHAVIVGRENPGPYREVARSLGVDERLHFVPYADPLEDFYNGCDIYVFPTYYESFGLTLLEAMACGKPVVCTRNAGVSELLTDGKDSLFLEHWDDPRELAGLVSRAMDEAFARGLGHKARRTAEQYTWERTIRATRQVYEAALRR